MGVCGQGECSYQDVLEVFDHFVGKTSLELRLFQVVFVFKLGNQNASEDRLDVGLVVRQESLFYLSDKDLRCG